MSHLLGNQATSGFVDNTGTHAGATRGLRFQVATTVSATQLGWYRTTTGVGTAFHRLFLYGPAGEELAEVAAPADNGLVGWQWSTITPVALATGTTYTVATATDGGAGVRIYPYAPCTGRPAAPSPFLHDDGCHFASTSTDTYPTTSDSTAIIAVSVDVTPVDPAEPDPADPATAGDLQRWLSADPVLNTHETDGLPWLTKLVAEAILTGQAAGRIVIDATRDIVDLIPNRTDPEWTKILNLWEIAGVLTEAEIELWNLFAKRAPNQLTGPTSGGGSAFFGPGGIQVSEAAEQILLASDKLWHRTETTNWLIPVPGSEWLKADELTYTGPIGWNQEADVYVNRFTSWPATADRQDIGDNIWLPRAGWWAPLTGTIPHERRFMDFDVQLLHNLPLRSSGILLVPRGGYEGVIEAWIRPDV